MNIQLEYRLKLTLIVTSPPINKPFPPILRSMFINGPPKHAANAIKGYPNLAMTISLIKSPTEFPMANTVKPSIASDNCVRTEINFKLLMSSSAIRDIHDIEAINPMTERAIFKKSIWCPEIIML